MTTGNMSKSVNFILLTQTQEWNTGTMNNTGQEDKVISKNEIKMLG